MSRAIDYLVKEHEIILRVVDKADEVCTKLNATSVIDKEYFRKFIEFIRNYADKFHHAKEENILFEELNNPSVEMHCNPCEQMMFEHNLGRDFMKKIEEGLLEEDSLKIISNVREYSVLIRSHIQKEDNILYVMADEVLKAEILEKMFDKFLEIDSKKNVEKYLDFSSSK